MKMNLDKSEALNTRLMRFTFHFVRFSLTQSRVFAAIALTTVTSFGLQADQAEVADNIVTNQFKEVDTLFSNPGQGWMVFAEHSPEWQTHHVDAARFPCSVVYVRFNWADVEPEEGRYNWKLIDDATNYWHLPGAAVAIRVMCTSMHSAGKYCSPKWLFDDGCRGFEYREGSRTVDGKNNTRIEPDYSDPIFLTKHAAFLAALGKRYNGKSNVEFVDIGTYGMWAEWHTHHPASLAVRQQIVDMYLKAFPSTPLVFMTDDSETLSYALAHGVGLRRDGVGAESYNARWAGSPDYAGSPGMADAWKKAPVVFEWWDDYAYLKSRGWSFDAAVNFMLNNHVTMINDNIGKVPSTDMPQLEKLARLSGYRFVLREVTHEKPVAAGSDLHVNMKWANVGVGKLYRHFDLQVALLKANDQVVDTLTVSTDPREWLPGERNIAVSMPLSSSLQLGEYTIAVALTDPAGHLPPLNLAMDAPDKDGWYRIGHIIVK